MDAEMLDLISENYKSFGDVSKVEKAEGYSINSQNYVVYFSNGRKAICKYFPESDASLVKLLSIMKFCEENGAKVPVVLETDSKKMINEYKSGVFYLLSFRKGRFFDGTVSEVRDVAGELAALHKQLKKCPIEYEALIPIGKYKHLSPEDIDSVVSKIKEKNETSDFDRYVLENINFLKLHYEIDGKKKKEMNENEITIQYVHGDLHPGNVLFNDGKTEVILDLNSLRKSELARDVAFACFRFAFYNTDDKNEIKERKDAFVGFYLKKNELTGEEINSLEYYFANECLNRISYILRGHYFEGGSEWTFDLKKHINNIKIMEGL